MLNAARFLVIAASLFLAGLLDAGASVSKTRVGNFFAKAPTLTTFESLQIVDTPLENWSLYDWPASGQQVWTSFDPEGLKKIEDYNKDIVSRNRRIKQLDRQIDGKNVGKDTKAAAANEKAGLERANAADNKARDKIEASAQWINDKMQQAVDSGEMESFRPVQASGLDDESGLFAGIQQGMQAQSIMDFSNGLMVASQVIGGVAAIGELATVGVARMAAGALSKNVGKASLYEDVTAAGSRYANRATNVTKAEFEKNLIESGFVRSVSQDGKVIILEKAGARYVLRDAARSTGGPTADYFNAGSKSIDIKIRLEGGMP